MELQYRDSISYLCLESHPRINKPEQDTISIFLAIHLVEFINIQYRRETIESCVVTGFIGAIIGCSPQKF